MRGKRKIYICFNNETLVEPDTNYLHLAYTIDFLFMCPAKS